MPVVSVTHSVTHKLHASVYDRRVLECDTHPHARRRVCLATAADSLFLDNNTHAGTGHTYNNTHAGTGHTYNNTHAGTGHTYNNTHAGTGHTYNNTHAGTGHTYNNTHARTGQTYTHARAHTSNPTSPHKHTHGRGGGAASTDRQTDRQTERERESHDCEMTASSAKPFTSTPVYKGRTVSTGYKAKWRSEQAAYHWAAQGSFASSAIS